MSPKLLLAGTPPVATTDAVPPVNVSSSWLETVCVPFNRSAMVVVLV
jgi:hypothetical protein